MEKLHPGAKWLFRLRVYGSVFVILLFLIYTSFTRLSFGSTSTGTIILIALVILVVVLILIGELYARLAYSYWKYEFASNGLKIEKGIIFKTYKTIPYNRIQNVDVTRGILARILNFSTLEIHTAGYSSAPRKGRAHAEGYIPAVSLDAGEKIQGFLMKKIYGKGI
jgi:putative membrane protein